MPMASYIHAGIPSSLWANPPKHPSIIYTSLLGNLTLQQCLFMLPTSFSVLTQFLQWTPFHSLPGTATIPIHFSTFPKNNP
jgi:hypothetical protein